MTPRTYETLYEAVWQAMIRNDSPSLQTCAAELDELATDDSHALAARARGWASYCDGAFSLALEYFMTALRLYTQSGNRSGMARVHSNIGSVHSALGSFPLSIEHHHRALGLYEELGERTVLAGATGNIGIAYTSIGWYPQALVQFHRALELHTEMDHRSGIANTLSNIGIALYHTDDLVHALEMYTKALQLFAEDGDRAGIARVHGNIGIVRAKMGEYDVALSHYVRAHELFQEAGNQTAILRSKANMIRTYIDLQDNQRALALIDTIDRNEVTVPDVRIMIEESCSVILAGSGSYADATECLNRALEVSMAHSMLAEQAQLHIRLRDIAFAQNDLQAYVHHNTAFTEITEKIKGKDASVQIAMQDAERRIQNERRDHERHMAVLHSTLPKHVADRVARGEVVNDHFENATVIFLDIVGFTALSSSMSSQEVISLLDNVYTQCDSICAKHGVTKIKTIGDSYMCVSFDSVVNAALCALEMSRINASHEVSHSVSHEVPLVTCHSSLVTQLRGSVDIKGKGQMRTYWLESKA